MNAALAVAAGGAAGSLARYWIVLALKRVDDGFPWGTLAVNLLGSAAIGVVWAYLVARPESPDWLRHVSTHSGQLAGALPLRTTR